MNTVYCANCKRKYCFFSENLYIVFIEITFTPESSSIYIKSCLKIHKQVFNFKYLLHNISLQCNVILSHKH